MTTEVSKRVEEAIFYRLKQRAFRECDQVIKAYGECCRGRVISLVWACRSEAKAMNICVGQYTSKMDIVKQRWVDAGGTAGVVSDADWEALFDKLVV